MCVSKTWLFNHPAVPLSCAQLERGTSKNSARTSAAENAATTVKPEPCFESVVTNQRMMESHGSKSSQTHLDIPGCIVSTPKPPAERSFWKQAALESGQTNRLDRDSPHSLRQSRGFFVGGRLATVLSLDMSCPVRGTPRCRHFGRKLPDRDISARSYARRFLIFQPRFPTPCASNQCISAS